MKIIQFIPGSSEIFWKKTVIKKLTGLKIIYTIFQTLKYFQKKYLSKIGRNQITKRHAKMDYFS